MANVIINIDGNQKTITSGKMSQPSLVKLTVPTTNAVPRLRIPALNQIFSAQDNVTINGGEVITSGLF
jgi:hypothetical protein